MRTFLLAVMLWTLALSPLPAEAAPAEATDPKSIHCIKDGSFDTLVIVLRIGGKDYGTCTNGGSGGLTADDKKFLVEDTIAHSKDVMGVDGPVTKVWTSFNHGPWVRYTP